MGGDRRGGRTTARAAGADAPAVALTLSLTLPLTLTLTLALIPIPNPDPNPDPKTDPKTDPNQAPSLWLQRGRAPSRTSFGWRKVGGELRNEIVLMPGELAQLGGAGRKSATMEVAAVGLQPIGAGDEPAMVAAGPPQPGKYVLAVGSQAAGGAGVQGLTFRVRHRCEATLAHPCAPSHTRANPCTPEHTRAPLARCGCCARAQSPSALRSSSLAGSSTTANGWVTPAPRLPLSPAPPPCTLAARYASPTPEPNRALPLSFAPSPPPSPSRSPLSPPPLTLAPALDRRAPLWPGAAYATRRKRVGGAVVVWAAARRGRAVGAYLGALEP